MNILHYVTKKQEISPKLKKLKSISDAESQEDDAVDGAEKVLDNESGSGVSPFDKDELEKRLSPAQFRVTQQLGTEK